MADRLNVSNLDFDQIKDSLKQFLKQQSEFQDYDFEGSGLSVLLNILAYNTHYNSYYLNMVANESFMDSAMLRNSVVSHAKKYGYVPHSTVAPRAVITVTVDSGDSTPGYLTLPRGYVFVSNLIDNKAYNFVTLNENTVAKSGNNFTFSNINIYEGNFVSYRFNHSQLSNPKQLFTIPEETIDTSTLTVSVQQSTSNSDIVVYNKVSDVMTVTANSDVYFLQEGQNGQYEIYFGDNVIGRSIPDGAIVNCTYLATSGTNANKANNFIATDSISGYSNVVVSSITAATGGHERETVDDIKFSAPLQFLSGNRAVTKNDYIRLIIEKYPSLQAVNVWGGEENNPPVYGKVFISAKPELGFEITETEKAYIIENIVKPMSMLTVTPVMVDVDYNYLKITSEVFYDPTKTTMSMSDIELAIRNLIINFADTNLGKFNSYFDYSGLETAVANYNKSIISNEIEFMIGKKFRPDLINPQNYVLDYGVELKRGTTFDNFYSTPTFGVLDEEGVVRNCFFEEIPSSYSGLESVTITNPGFNYTTTPTITVVGDGQGATAVATIVNGKLTKIDVTNPGVGYTSAIIQITGNGSLGTAEAVLQGRYGQIRMSYYKLDATSSGNVKTVMNANKNNGICGTIDYKLGKVYLTQFNPISVNNDFKDIMIFMKPKSNIIQSKLNKMLVLDSADPASIVIETTKIST